MNAKRCLHCLLLQHFVRNCAFSSKCRVCGPHCRNTLAGALHESFSGMNLVAADRLEPVFRPVPALRTRAYERGVQGVHRTKPGRVEVVAFSF